MKGLLHHTDIEKIAAWLGTGSINIFGAPFAGKDTHGRELAELLNTYVLSGGDIIRNSVIPDHVKALNDAGELVPSQDYIDIVTPYFKSEKFQNLPLILSSVGRWKGEEEGVISSLKESGHPLKAVVYLNINPEVAYKRWESSRLKQDRGNRADDAEHLLDVRLEEFRVKTLPVIEFYREKGQLIEVDGIAPQEEVSEIILRALLDRATS